ncbi:uncharacterized protein EV154DRAFT_484586 [Mucor mucedo]|uniref:uncharacterized protein n=1 Tax=Mucor mucedo TaxID=29922 RepID=UPI002220307C|nr:uncharacterized protein EV154DRAFT_484586 [Mucor mucedo]KAI7887940.1 hypothetical protein EV154DRAFT_484586 [Mucor mucedo]
MNNTNRRVGNAIATPTNALPGTNAATPTNALPGTNAATPTRRFAPANRAAVANNMVETLEAMNYRLLNLEALHRNVQAPVRFGNAAGGHDAEQSVRASQAVD